MATNTPKSKDNDDLDIGLLLNTLIALRRGDFETRMPNDWTGLPGRDVRTGVTGFSATRRAPWV